MRLVVATPLYPPEIGGPATYAKALEEGLPGKGVGVILVKFGTIRHLPRLLRHYAFYRRILAALRAADAVLALDPVSVGLPSMWAARKAGKPFVVKIVGDYAWEQGRQRFGVVQELDEFIKTPQKSFAVRQLQRVQTSVARAATRIIVPSEYLKKIVVAWGIPGEKISVIYNAVPAAEAGKPPEAFEVLGHPRVLTAGRLVPWKNFGGVIAASTYARVTLAIAGDGPLRDSLAGKAVLLGSLEHGAMLGAIRAADVFVINSSYEGLSHFLIEALALGVPTVATRVGGNPEVITDGENGLLVPVADDAALASAIRRLLDEPGLKERLAHNAKASAARFAPETMLARTAELVQSLL